MRDQSTVLAPIDIPAPIETSERIFSLDAIRGVALLGIFIMNMPGFNTSFSAGADGTHLWPAWWDRTAETLRDVLFSGKFNSMFSLLFAVGFTIQLQRLRQKDPARGAWIYARRTFWLLVFGIVHACVFWTGDVLHMYGLFGFALLLLRRVPNRFIVALIVACLLYSPIFGIYRYFTLTPDDIERMVASARVWEASNNLAYGHGTFLQAAAEHTREMIAFYTDPDQLPGAIGFIVQMITTMLIGLLLGRFAFFQTAGQHLDRVRRAQWWALGLGIATGVYFGTWEALTENPAQPTPWRVLASVCYSVCRISMMIFYVSIIVRVAHSTRWKSKLTSLAIIGRMPLSNYLLQTLIATFIFYGWGLGFWGKASPTMDLILAIGIYFAVQLPLSIWWLKHFQLGPMEYLWRVLTYGRAALRRSTVALVQTT